MNPSKANELQPGVVELDKYRTIEFLLEHFKNANLLQTGETHKNAPDIHLSSNEEFWSIVFDDRNLGLKWVELSQFQVIDWFPRTPGLYHTDEAGFSRHKALYYLEENSGIKFYSPHGKGHMIDGGIGCIRFKPITIDRQELFLCTATSDNYAHSGVPIAIPSHLFSKLDFSNHKYWYKISGQVKFLPGFLEHHFLHMRRIPQIYVLVDSLDILSTDISLLSVQITPMVFFSGEVGWNENDYNYNREMRRGCSATYVTCRADSLVELDRAADWLNWYATHYKGEIITNYDEQRPMFENAVFSLQNVMKGVLDGNRMSEFYIENANIICDEIHGIHSETTNMTQIEVKLGNGTIIHGDFIVANSIKDSFNKVASSEASSEIKDLLAKLTSAVGKMIEHLPKEIAEQVGRDLASLVNEATSPAPRQQWLQLSLDGLKKAAQDVLDVGKPVIEIAGMIAKLLLIV